MAPEAGAETIGEISTVSISEIAIKRALGKLGLGREQVVKSIEKLKARILPYTADTLTSCLSYRCITEIPLTGR